MLAGDFHVSVAAQHADVAAPRRDYDCGFPGKADIHIGCDRAVAGALGIGIQSYDVAVDRELGLGGGIIFVRVSLAVGIDPLVRGHVNLVIVRSGQVHRSAIAVDAQAAARRKVLLELVFVTVVVPEQGDILVSQIDVVANLIPVKARSLGGRHSEHDQENQQQHSAGSDARGACSFSLRLLVLDQLDHAPENDQGGPVGPEPVQQRLGMKHAHGGQQQHDPQQDHHHRAGHGTPWSWRQGLQRRHGGRSLHRASHFSPPA